ncbi:MAG: hypothetical protein JO290_04615 [Sphingomonadaceae bacterium]|nr:hypothetical protein [Sphingomonadaceae bacterium]
MRVESGHVVALRLFDLAYAIDLRRAGDLWAARTGSAGARSQLAATPAKAVAFEVPPLELDLGPVALALGPARASARLYDFGIAALAIRLPVAGLSWAAFTARVADVDAAVGAAAGDALWPGLLDRVRDAVAAALDRPSAVPLQDDHLIATVEAFDTAVAAEALEAAVDLVPLLSGQTRPLSPSARADLLRHRFSYHPDDLAIVTWDRAFLYEPRGDSDVADVVELANAQLLELRVYDAMLDDELPRMQALVDAARRRVSIFGARRYARLARRLYTLVAEVSQLTERVDNALQVTEDVYLARVYAATIDLLRVPKVGDAVDRKLAIVRETYSALHSEAEGARAELLELAVLLLIAIEILLSLVRR